MEYKISLTGIILIITLFSFKNREELYRNYKGKFIKSQNGKIYPAEFEITFIKGKIYFTKGEKTTKYFTVDKGVIINNEGVKFHKFYLINKDIFILLSYDKNEILDNTQFHTLIINGKTHLIK